MNVSQSVSLSAPYEPYHHQKSQAGVHWQLLLASSRVPAVQRIPTCIVQVKKFGG